MTKWPATIGVNSIRNLKIGGKSSMRWREFSLNLRTMIGHFRLEDIVDLIKHCPTRSLKCWDDQGLKTCTNSILKQTANVARVREKVPRCKPVNSIFLRPFKTQVYQSYTVFLIKEKPKTSYPIRMQLQQESESRLKILLAMTASPKSETGI